jgi:transglutaminase-like putative cysteine protease
MLLEIEHHLALDYDEFIRESVIELRMQPKTTADQSLLSFVLSVGPPAPIARYRDWLGNLVHHFGVTSYHDRVAVAARSLVRTHPAGPGLADLDDPVPLPPPAWALQDFLALAGPVRDGAALQALEASLDAPAAGRLGDVVAALGDAVHARFAYRRAVTRFDSTTDDFIAARAGVCQDFAHLLLALLRRRGVPCRYVSGYLHVPAGDEPAQSHAWIEVHSPSRGWVAYDPTHARPVDERYVVVGHGRTYEDVPPNRGLYRGGAQETLTAEVYTRPSADKPVSTLFEEIGHIDLPVFQEIPERRRPWSPAAVDAGAQQEQQQQ